MRGLSCPRLLWLWNYVLALASSFVIPFAWNDIPTTLITTHFNSSSLEVEAELLEPLLISSNTSNVENQSLVLEETQESEEFFAVAIGDAKAEEALLENKSMIVLGQRHEKVVRFDMSKVQGHTLDIQIMLLAFSDEEDEILIEVLAPISHHHHTLLGSIKSHYFMEEDADVAADDCFGHIKVDDDDEGRLLLCNSRPNLTSYEDGVILLQVPLKPASSILLKGNPEGEGIIILHVQAKMIYSHLLPAEDYGGNITEDSQEPDNVFFPSPVVKLFELRFVLYSDCPIIVSNGNGTDDTVESLFQCSTSLCIPSFLRCDGEVHCLDQESLGEDEKGCDGHGDIKIQIPEEETIVMITDTPTSLPIVASMEEEELEDGQEYMEEYETESIIPQESSRLTPEEEDNVVKGHTEKPRKRKRKDQDAIKRKIDEGGGGGDPNSGMDTYEKQIRQYFVPTASFLFLIWGLITIARKCIKCAKVDHFKEDPYYY